jgi:hypothetical protein
LGCFSLLLLTACSNEEPPQNQPIEETPEPAETEENLDNQSRHLAPLTGRAVEEPIDQRVIGVMIDNHSKARPQSGLGQADIVYEILAEGEITRYLALFHSQIPEVIGPVRSLRPYYLDIARGYDAIIAHAGGSPEAKAEVDRTGYPSLDGTRSGGFAFYRTDHRRPPHNLYTGREQLMEGQNRFGYNENYQVPELPFTEENETIGGEEATWVEIDYLSGYKVAYEYDDAKGVYTRSVKGEIHTDEQTHEPITASNILVIEASHEITDSAGRREVNVTGEGKGYLFQQGKVQDITWRYTDGVIRPFVDGTEAALYPGQTWVNIIPDSPGLTDKVSYSNQKP